MKARACVLAVVMVFGLAAAAYGDGMIVPIRPDLPVRGSWKVLHHHVDMKVRDQVASVSIDQAFANTGKGMIEVEYLFPVPPGAAIDSMTLMVNGKEFAAKLLKADEARKIYEDIVRKKKDPALLEYAGFGLYRTRAFPLEPGKPVKVLVTYKQICRRDRDLVEVWYPLNTEKFSATTIESVRVTVDVQTKADVTAVYSPTHDLTVKRHDSRHVTATYEAKNTLPTQDFQVFYKAANEKVGATLMTHQPDAKEDGYFMMLVSPNPRDADAKAVPKDIVLVLDRSGSMNGQKIKQAKEAMQFVLNSLNKKDRFNVIAYSDSVDTFFDGLVDVNKAHLDRALGTLDRIDATGGTNIDEAIVTAMKIICASAGERPKYVIFMTDGLPTVGKTGEADILKDAEAANTAKARLFAFGVGYDVNVRLLDTLVEKNHGRSDYCRPNEPIESKISSLYAKIKNPVMTKLEVTLSNIKLKDMYPRALGDLFEGDQLVVVGRYDSQAVKGLAKNKSGYQGQLVIKGIYMGKERAFEYPVTICVAGKDLRYSFVEKLWAVRRVGFLLDEIQLRGKSQEVVDELVRLSMKYGIITPYTSFLADERTALNRPAAVRRAAVHASEGLAKATSGRKGQMGGKARQSLRLADRAAAPAPAVSQPSVAGGPGGYAEPSDSVYVYGNTRGADYEADKKEVATGVRQSKDQTLYRRGDVWVASNAAKVDVVRDKDKIQRIERFTEEYFTLVKGNTAAENQVLSMQRANEKLLIELRGQVYMIE